MNVVPLIDAVLYVIKYDSVKKSLVNSCVRRLWESKKPVLGAILNNVSAGLSTYYYSQYSNKKYSEYYLQDSYLDLVETSDSLSPESSENSNSEAETGSGSDTEVAESDTRSETDKLDS